MKPITDAELEVLWESDDNPRKLVELLDLRPEHFEEGLAPGGSEREFMALRGAAVGRTVVEAYRHGRWDFHGQDLRSADLEGASLQRAALVGVNLQGAYLQDANLQRAILIDANLQRAYLQDANLTGAILERAEVPYTDLQDARAHDANLTGANLTGATFHVPPSDDSSRGGTTGGMIA